MKIIVDVMSGDHAPLEILRGALMAKEEYHEEMILVGDESVIRQVAHEHRLSLDDVSIVHAPSVITMEDRALTVVREKNDSSMAIGLHLLACGEGDAFVSAGNTGALLAGASLIVRRIRGIHRAGIATILPFATPCLLMDSGANLSLNAVDYEQMAFMGAKYMQHVLHVDNPRVALLNNGSEATKGSEELQEAYHNLLVSEVNFVGNCEGRDIPTGMCDVLLTDGFTGNIILKYTEGMSKYMMQTVQNILSSGKKTRSSASTLLPFEEIQKKFDSTEYGGAPLLGISKPVIKAHGYSNALAIKNAILRTIAFSGTGVNRDIAMYALNFDERHDDRIRREAEEERAREKQEKRKTKRKKKQSDATGITDDTPNDGRS